MTRWYIDKPRINKYGNVRTKLDGIEFDSRKEANYYAELKLLEKAGEVTAIERQPRFELLDPFMYKGEKLEGVRYYADFRVTYADGHVEVIDVKSAATRKDRVYVIKKKLLLTKYPDIDFREV